MFTPPPPPPTYRPYYNAWRLSALLLAFASSIFGQTVTYPTDTIIDPYDTSLTSVGPSPSPSSPSNNTVTFNSGGTSDEITGNVYGGYSEDSTATENNQVTINSVTGFDGNDNYIFGGVAHNSGDNASGTSQGNSVTFDVEGILNVGVVGGFSDTGSVTNNSVTISGGPVGVVFGGQSSSGPVTNNFVTISGGNVDNEVYGGYSLGGSATGNSVIIAGTPTFSSVNTSIYGGFGYNNIADHFTGNIFTWDGASSISIQRITNFETYKFFLPASLADGGTLITVANANSLSGTTVTITGIESGGEPLAVGDKLTLISKSSDAPTTFNGTDVPKGLTETYDFELVTGVSALQIEVTARSVNPQIKVFSEGWITGLELINQGGDLVETQGFNAAIAATAGKSGVSLFGAANASALQYQTGSHNNVSGWAFLAGAAYQKSFSPCSVALAGGFAEGGTGSYNSFNSFVNSASVTGAGNTSYVGGGFLAYYQPFQELYFELSGRAGSTSTNFNTDNMAGFIGTNMGYSRQEVPYYGAHIGVGTLLPWKKRFTADLSTKLLWTMQEGTSFRISNDFMRLEPATSLRLRGKARLFYELFSQFSPFAGVAYEYEFDGIVNASLNNIPIDPPSLRGSTGMGELGVMATPIKGRPLFLELNVQGFLGVRQGVSGILQVKRLF